jgi:hypothetical protein
MLNEPRAYGLLVTEGIRGDENLGRDEDVSLTRSRDQHTGPPAVGRCRNSGAAET